MAGGSMKDIKRRIRSIESTGQITKAMELVASSKLRRAKERALACAPFFDELYQTVCDISSYNSDFSSIYVKPREVKNSLYIIIAGDRGLAGGYNSNVMKLAEKSMKSKNAKVIAIGKRAVEHYSKREMMVKGYSGVAENLDQLRVEQISQVVIEMYQKGEIDEVYICYTEFISALSQEPLEMKILPLSNITEPLQDKSYIEYEPSPEEVFDRIVPYYVSGIIYGAVVESYASEQGARRTAMESANDNAKEIIEKLSLSYNRARQATITQEISEIVSGAGNKK